jgi:hypothetical protein
MKTTKLTLILAGLLLASTVIVSSCKKKEPTEITKDSDSSGASDNHLAESTSNDIVSMGSQASDNTTASLNSYRLGNGENQILGLSCATVTRDTTTKVIIVTFNSSSTPCLDGRTRSGTIVYTYSNSVNGAKHYRDPGFELDVTSSNYVVDGNAVTINNKTIKNTTPIGFNPATVNATWSISANITVNKPSGVSVSWSCNHTKTLLNTSITYPSNPVTTPIDWPNARIGITGNANGTRSNGETFTVNITNQLVRDFGGCNINGRRPFIQGTFDFTPSGKATRTFDYGSGTCDLNATVTINGVSYPITLP